MDTKNLLTFFILASMNAMLTRILLRNLNYFMMSKGIYGIDINKEKKVKIPEEGGVSITLSLVYTFCIMGYYFHYKPIIPIMITTTLICLIGFIDHFRNIKPYPKFIYCAIVGFIYAIPFSELHPANGNLVLAVLTIVAIGIVYSVFVNAYNVLAGFNGLESGVTIISSLALALFFFLHGFVMEAAVAFLVTVSYTVFWMFNKYPAQIFIGDSGTLVPASIYMGLGLQTGYWLPVVIVLIPHLLNIGIKFLSTGVSSRSDHSPLEFKNGHLVLPENYYMSLIRLFLLSGPKKEKQIVYYVYSLELISCSMLLLVR